MTLIKDLPAATLPLSGFEKMPGSQVFAPDDVAIRPIDIATMPVQSRADANTTIVPTLADAFVVIETTATSAVIFVIPSHATVPYAVGVVLQNQQIGTGRITNVPAGGVTVRWPKAADGTTDCTKARAINSPAAFRQRAVDDWVVEGDLSST